MARVFALPVELKKKMTDPAGDDLIFSQLLNNYKTSEEQAIEIARIVRDILLGDLAYNNLANKLTNLLGNTSDSASNIKYELDRFFFVPVFSELEKLPINQSLLETPPPTNNPNNIIDLRDQK